LWYLLFFFYYCKFLFAAFCLVINDFHLLCLEPHPVSSASDVQPGAVSASRPANAVDKAIAKEPLCQKGKGKTKLKAKAETQAKRTALDELPLPTQSQHNRAANTAVAPKKGPTPARVKALGTAPLLAQSGLPAFI
jgi:hypothetical protein